MNRIHIAFIISILLLFPGCVSDGYYQESMSGERTRIDFSQSQTVCPTGDCVCMTCGTTAAPEPYSIFYNFSYARKTCSFKPCTQEQYIEKLNPNAAGEYMNFLMLGQGGFGDFDTANPFCNNSLRMPVKWLDVKNSVDDYYPRPDPGRATCFLEKGSIPVYILYSGGRSVTVDRAREIAALFNGMGPVILTTEMGFDSSDPTIRSAVEQQAAAMKSACPNCLIALAPRIGDNSTGFDQVARDISSYVDLFAFGIDSRNSSSCDSSALYYEAVSYSEELLYKYKKPSVLAYVLFDTGWNEAHTCLWDESAIAAAYSNFYTYAPAFPSSGIIGVSLYSLSGVGSLPCEGCGLLDAAGNPTPSQPAWFSQCQQAYASKAIIPLVFSDSPGTACMFGPSAYSYAGTSFYTQFPPAQSPATAAPGFYRCDACLVEKNPSSAKLAPIIPSNPIVDGLEVDLCKAYPALDSYADIRDLDPALVRATVTRESGFDPCATSNDTKTCGKSPGMAQVEDPDGECGTFTARSGQYACAMGLMQTLVPPYTYWEEVDFEHAGQMRNARSCSEDEKFNPYNPQHSACIGTAELADAVAAAKRKVDNNAAKILGGLASGSDDYESMKGLAIVMIARLYYAGPALVSDSNVAAWANGFDEFRNAERTCDDDPDSHPCCDGSNIKDSLARAGCCGSGADFVNYVTNEQCYNIRPKNSNEGGSNKPYIVNTNSFVRMYLGVREKCGVCNEELWKENLENWAASNP